MYVPAEGQLEFGDIFSARWFFDAYLRRDAVPLVEFQGRGGSRAWRRAEPSSSRDLVFTHGQQRAALLLSDDCEIETILRRGGRSRLVFAAVEQLPVDASDATKALESRAFRRFGLRRADAFAGGIVEFQQLFAVSSDAVLKADDGIDPRVARLNPEARLQLEMRWNAYAVRRGPLTHLDNAEKLARLLSSDGDAEKLRALTARSEDPTPDHQAAALAIVAAMNAAWDIEGAVFNKLGEAYERGDEASAIRNEIVENLRGLAAKTQRAAALLAATGEKAATEEPPDLGG
jgi:hypothetical protein